MLTRIAELCKEIRVIKSNQINKGLFTPKGAKTIHGINSTSKLSKFTDRNIPAGRGNDVPDDLHGGYYGSKISNPRTHPNDSTDTIHDCADNPAQTPSSQAPPLPSRSHTSLPPPSESPVMLVALKHDSSTGIGPQKIRGEVWWIVVVKGLDPDRPLLRGQKFVWTE